VAVLDLQDARLLLAARGAELLEGFESPGPAHLWGDTGEPRWLDLYAQQGK
jgi:hypothetical protein